MGVTYLLDTHVFLWVLANPDVIPPQIRASLADRDNPMLVSAISAFEITTKARLGKLEAGDLPFTFVDRVEQIGAKSLPVSAPTRSVSWLDVVGSSRPLRPDIGSPGHGGADHSGDQGPRDRGAADHPSPVVGMRFSSDPPDDRVAGVRCRHD